MSSSVIHSLTELRRLEAEFRQTSLDLLVSRSSSALRTTTRARDLISSLNRLARDYSDAVATLKGEIYRLNKRERSAREAFATSPAIDASDIESVAKLEAEYERVAQFLAHHDLTAVERKTEAEMSAVKKLERKNAKRRALLSSREPRRGRIMATKTDSFEQMSMTESGFSVGELATQIRELSGLISERRGKLRAMRREADLLEAESLKDRSAQEQQLAQKEQRVNELRAQCQVIESLKSGIENISGLVLRRTQELSDLRRSREQLDRQNFTAARDRHTNSKTMQKLELLRQRYSEAINQYQRKEAILKQRRTAYSESEEDVSARAERVRLYEIEVQKLENMVTSSGAKFSGTLSQSQIELATLDLLASRRTRKTKGQTLEEELSMILHEEQGGDNDDDPLRQLED
jgi:hypothetical protein